MKNWNKYLTRLLKGLLILYQLAHHNNELSNHPVNAAVSSSVWPSRVGVARPLLNTSTRQLLQSFRQNSCLIITFHSHLLQLKFCFGKAVLTKQITLWSGDVLVLTNYTNRLVILIVCSISISIQFTWVYLMKDLVKPTTRCKSYYKFSRG